MNTKRTIDAITIKLDKSSLFHDRAASEEELASYCNAIDGAVGAAYPNADVEIGWANVMATKVWAYDDLGPNVEAAEDIERLLAQTWQDWLESL